MAMQGNLPWYYNLRKQQRNVPIASVRRETFEQKRARLVKSLLRAIKDRKAAERSLNLFISTHVSGRSRISSLSPKLRAEHSLLVMEVKNAFFNEQDIRKSLKFLHRKLYRQTR